MELIKAIFPLLGVLIGWLLSESGKIFADKRQDRRKLKKLLYFLLELRFHFAKELSIELDLDKYIETIKNKMATKLGIDKNDPEFVLGVSAWRPFIEQILTKSKTQENKFEHLTENIDKVLIDLAEIFPILAYELSGQHNIKERLNKFDNYLSEIKTMTDEVPFDIKQWINPKLTKELLADLDESILKIAKKIDKQTTKFSKEKITKMSNEDDDQEMETFLDEYLEKVIESFPKQ